MASTSPASPGTKETPAVDKRFIEDLADLTTIGRYEIKRKIGQGGTAVVFLGMDPYIQRKVAIKISQPTTDKSRRKFFLEAQSAGRLNHPGIVAIFDAGVYKSYCYITMEYIEGNSLEAYCSPDNLMPIHRAVETIFHACQSLDYAHKEKVIHRDIKPSNIMLDATGMPKIADFGIAQITEQTSEMGVWGTPSYMAPEQLKDEEIGSFSDIFSMGCVLYEMLTGARAFPGENNFAIMYKITNTTPADVESLKPEIPTILGNIIRKSMAKDRRERYQTCLDFAYDLRVALRGLTNTVAVDGKARDVIDLVHNVPFFHNFSRDQLSELVSDTTIIKFTAETVIVDEGDIDDTFYVILSGRARITKNVRIIATIGVGECFGEMACIAGQARTASVIADTDCILMKISATLIDRSSESIQLLFFKNFATTLVRRLSDT
ncbi:MAG: serine/threonine-protein kinase [Pseudomonadota bacterium]